MTSQTRAKYEKRAHYLTLYRHLGLAAVPLVPKSKLPARKGWQSGAPRLWEGVGPEANVGVLTGSPSGGLAVLDFDRPALCVEVTGLTPDELGVHTGIVKSRRGWHVYGMHPGVQTTVPFDGFSVLGEGSLVVAPPSVHKTGHEYRWLAEPRRIAPLTSFVSEDVLRPPGAGEGNTRSNTTTSNTAGGGGEPTGTTRTARQIAARAEARARGARPEWWPRVEAWMARQSPKLRASWEALQAPAAPGFDRSRADFAVALSLAESDFETEEIVTVLLACAGSKTTERGEDYARRTVGKALTTAGR